METPNFRHFLKLPILIIYAAHIELYYLKAGYTYSLYFAQTIHEFIAYLE
jgi:hypothetical protein